MGAYKRTAILDGNGSRLGDLAVGISELKTNRGACGDVGAPGEGVASETGVLLESASSRNSAGVDTAWEMSTSLAPEQKVEYIRLKCATDPPLRH